MSKQERGSCNGGDTDRKINCNGNMKFIHPYELTEESITASQDFHLRLSQDSNQTDACTEDIDYDRSNDEKDVIVISDSSSESFSPTHPSRSTYKSKRTIVQNGRADALEGSDTESSDWDANRLFREWNAKGKQNVDSNNRNGLNRHIIKKKNGLFSTDESSSDSSENYKQQTNSSNKTDSTHVSATPQNVEYDIKTSTKITSWSNSKYMSTTNSSSSCTSSSNSNTFDQMNIVQSPSNSSNSSSTRRNKLTKKDTYNILKNIKSTRAVYESPRKFNENNVIIDESIDDDVHPAISSHDNMKIKNTVIDESPVDSESDIIEASQVNLDNPYKSHISRFLDAPDLEKKVNGIEVELSERKKKLVSQWLMTNSPDSRSDSSFSHVPPSNRDSVSSGNSSLERLEMNYETPNNRGKISRVPVNEKGMTIADCNRVINSTVSRQRTLHDYVEKSKDDTLHLRTPTNNHTNDTSVSTSVVNTPQNINIETCSHILDKLYGNVWREKADILLPSSEPRKKAISPKNRYIQTEKKPINRKYTRKVISSNKGSNTPLGNITPQHNTEKKSVKRNYKPRDSFINDEEPSESESDSLYYTALTNPRTSTNSVPSKTPSIPRTVERVFSICDSDSDEEDSKRSTDQRIDTTRRKRLSFSDTEDDGSSTSEFDPGDDIPPKPIYRKEHVKTPRQVSKANGKVESSLSNNQKYQKCQSFLSSLSENVPIINAHPDAKKYRTDFKNNKENLCKYLYELYNEKVFDKKLPDDMLIEWNVRMRGTAGFCYNKKSIKTLGGVVKSSRIVLSTKVLDTPDRLRDTLIHEMCHAAAWLINDVSDGHGQFWTGWANKAMRVFPELPPIRRCHDYKIKTKFTYKCTGCGYSIGRHSKSLDVERKRCGHCYGKFELLVNKSTKSGIVQVQTPKRELSAFALYVKENYSSVKKDRNIKHADVMKLLGQQFSAIKIAKKANDDVQTPC